MLLCEIYASFTLATVGLFAWLGRDYDVRTWTLAPFLPGLFAPWFVEHQGFMGQILGLDKGTEVLRFSVCGSVLAMVIVGVCVVVCFCFGWGKVDERREVEDPESMPVGALKAITEEIGWRCFLLQALVSQYGLMNSIVLCGAISGAFHVPVQWVVMRRMAPLQLALALALGFVSNVLRGLLKGWLAFKTGYSVWASALFQLSLERFGPVITGSLAAGMPGKLEGDLRLVSVDGVAGCMTLLPIAAFLLNNT